MGRDEKRAPLKAPAWEARLRAYRTVCLIWKVKGRSKDSIFPGNTKCQNGARTAIVFAGPPETHILKSSGFGFYNIITP